MHTHRGCSSRWHGFSPFTATRSPFRRTRVLTPLRDGFAECVPRALGPAVAARLRGRIDPAVAETLRAKRRAHWSHTTHVALIGYRAGLIVYGKDVLFRLQRQWLALSQTHLELTRFHDERRTQRVHESIHTDAEEEEK